MRGRRDGRIPEEVPDWLVAMGESAGPLAEAFLVDPGRGLLVWAVFGATAPPLTLLVSLRLGHDLPTWTTVAFCIALAGLVWLASKIANGVEARRWVAECGVRPTSDMVMALTADSLLLWNRSLGERTPEELILRRSRDGLTGKRCWGLMAFELTTGDGERLTFSTDGPTRPAVDRLLKMIQPPADAG